jgi:hypothetical protein
MNANFWVFAATLSLLASSARAAESLGVLALSEPPDPGPELVEITAQLRAALAERNAGVLDAATLRERMSSHAPSASLSELDRAFAGALATYQAGDFESSIRTLRAIVEDLERLPESAGAFELWSRVMLRLARSEATVGRRAEARAVLERLVRTNPLVEVDPTQYPPSFVTQVNEARAQVEKQRTRKLRVTSQKGVRVFVDGRDVGAAPVTVQLPPGKYRVSGAHQGVRVPGVTADLSSEDQAVELDLRLGEMLRPNAGPGLALAQAADRQTHIITASAWLGLDRVVVAALAQEAGSIFVVATLYDVRRGGTQREGRLRLTGGAPPPGGIVALATFLMTGQPSTLVAAGPPSGRAAELGVAPPRSSPFTPSDAERRPHPGGSTALGWSAVGTAALTVLLGGLTAYESLQASKRYDDASRMRGPDGTVSAAFTVSEYNGKIADGDSARNVAIGAGIGAGVTLGSTAVLGYLSYRRTGEIGPFRF